MTVQRIIGLNTPSLSYANHPIYYVCTTTGELPASGLKLGDTAIALDTNTQYKAASTTAWTPISTAGGAVPFAKTAAFSDASAVVPTTIPVWSATSASTVTALLGYRVGGTGATVQAYKNTTSFPLRSSALSLTSASTWMGTGGAVQNTAFASGDSLLIAVLSVAGAATQISVQVSFTKP